MVHLFDTTSSKVINDLNANNSQNIYPSVAYMTDMDKTLLVKNGVLQIINVPTDPPSNRIDSTVPFSYSTPMVLTNTGATLSEYMNKNMFAYTQKEFITFCEYFEETPGGYYRLKEKYMVGGKSRLDFAICNVSPSWGGSLTDITNRMKNMIIDANSAMPIVSTSFMGQNPIYLNKLIPTYLRPQSDVVTLFKSTYNNWKGFVFEAFRYFHPEFAESELLNPTYKYIFVKFDYYYSTSEDIPSDWTASSLIDTVYYDGRNDIENASDSYVPFSFKDKVHYKVYKDGNGYYPTQYEGNFSLGEFVKHLNNPMLANFF